MNHVYWDYCNANYSPEDIPRYVPCPQCRGRGLVNHSDAPEQEECEACSGAGEFEVTEPAGGSIERR